MSTISINIAYRINTNDMNTQRKHVKILNQYHTDLGTIEMNFVYDGYKLYTKKVESCTRDEAWYEISSNHPSGGTSVYKTKDEMMQYIDEWMAERG